jgi:hypothetical protein
MTQPGTPGNADAARPPLGGPVARTPAAASPAPGGEHEFARFYHDHIHRLAAYLMYQGAAADLAADIAQDAMITAYRKWAEIESPRAYTWTAAYRAFIRHVVNDHERPAGYPALGKPRRGCRNSTSSSYCGHCHRVSVRSSPSPSTAGPLPK